MFEFLPYVGFVALLGTVIGTAVKVTRRIDEVERAAEAKAEAAAGLVRSEAVEQIELVRRATGETGNAIRQKIHDVEVWTRDTMLRKDSFELVIARMEKSVEKMTDKLESKIDRAIERWDAPR